MPKSSMWSSTVKKMTFSILQLTELHKSFHALEEVATVAKACSGVSCTLPGVARPVLHALLRLQQLILLVVVCLVD